MGKPFTEFVLRLCTDARALQRFMQDPRKEVEAAGLTAAQAEALKSRNSDSVNQEIAREWPGEMGGGQGGIKKVYVVPENWVAYDRPGGLKKAVQKRTKAIETIKRAKKTGPRKKAKRKK